MKAYEITAEINLKKIIAESKEVAQALNEFVDDLEKIEKKYAKPQEKSENGMSLCDRCIHNNVCGIEGTYDPAMTYCSDFLGWTHVSEDMPKDGQNVLFCDNYDDVMIGYHVKGRPDTHFTQDGSFDDIKDVRAWMSLPGPYKTESEGCKITTEMDLKNMIAESREVAKALIGFANELERIEKKYAKQEGSEE